MVAVGIHNEDLKIAITVRREDDLRPVRRDIRSLIIARVRRDAGLTVAVRIHHVNFIVAVAAARHSDAMWNSGNDDREGGVDHTVKVFGCSAKLLNENAAG
jgi:hypothetical protein